MAASARKEGGEAQRHRLPPCTSSLRGSGSRRAPGVARAVSGPVGYAAPDAQPRRANAHRRTTMTIYLLREPDEHTDASDSLSPDEVFKDLYAHFGLAY